MSASRLPRVLHAYATARGTSTPGQIFTTIPAPSRPCPSRSRLERSAASAAAVTAAGHRSKRVNTTEPSSKGETAARDRAPESRAVLAPSELSASVNSSSSATPHATIKVSNAGSAPGGYATEKSRYGTFPRTIASPYSSYTGVSTIWPRSNQPWWIPIHEPTKTASATAAAAALTNGDGFRNSLIDDRHRLGHRLCRRQRRVGDEGEEPRDVEVRPVRQHHLESEQEDAGQRRELQRRLPPRNHSEDERRSHEERLEEPLHDLKVRDALRVVLAPVPDRERRLATELPRDGSLPEDAQRVADVGLEQDDRKRCERREDEADRRARNLGAREPIRHPHRRDDEGSELRPAGKRDERAARPGRRQQPEAPDEKRGQQRVVRVRARGILGERIRGPRERQHRP